MYDIKWLRENAEAFDAGLKRRGLEPLSVQLLKLDAERRVIVSSLQVAQERRNAASKLIGQAMAAKDTAKADELKAEVAALKETIVKGEAEQTRIDAALHHELSAIPNLPNADVPNGLDEHGNVEYRRHGERPNLAFTPKQHFELGEALGLMDFEAASRMSGARFVVLKGQLARLERALGQLFLDTHTGENGYTEVNPPLLVRDEAMFGTAQLPKFENDQYFASSAQLPSTASFADIDAREKSYQKVISTVMKQFNIQNSLMEDLKNWGPDDLTESNWNEILTVFDFILKTNESHFEFMKFVKSDLDGVRTDRNWLIPTAEVPLTNLVRESILTESELPKRFTALTPCFRAEAGSAGRDTRGMLRQHQFNKVELVSITTPEESAAEHERMLASAESLLKKLGLHYRVMTLCTGDMGFASQKTYDIEVWMPGQDTYREISSCSVCGDFQARRMDARFKGKDGKTQFVHTLNGSGVAVGRALIAVMENYQTADGSIEIPEVLHPYMGGLTRIEKAA